MQSNQIGTQRWLMEGFVWLSEHQQSSCVEIDKYEGEYIKVNIKVDAIDDIYAMEEKLFNFCEDKDFWIDDGSINDDRAYILVELMRVVEFIKKQRERKTNEVTIFCDRKG